MKKKLLFILNEYPPKTSPTSMAVKPIIDLLAHKYEIYVISIGNRKKKKMIDGVNVIYVNGGIEKLKFKNLKADNYLNYLKRFVLRVKQIIMIPCYPILRPVLQYKLWKTGLNICKKEKIDCVIGVCFPQEAIIASNKIKRYCPSVKYVPYLVDAFSGGTLPKYLPISFSRQRKIALEKKLIANADLAIAMEASKGFYRENNMDSKYTFLNPAFLEKPIISFPCEDKNIYLDKEKINIVYAGFLYLPDRDPTYIIRLLSSLKIQNMCLAFVGNCDSEVEQIIEREKKTFYGEIKQFKFIPREQLKYLLNEASFLLNMGVSNSHAISGKIFEYMAFGKPIITTYFDENDAALPYLRKYPLSCLINQENEDIKMAQTKMKDFLTGSNENRIPFSFVEREFYSSMPKAFSEVISSLVNGDNN